MEANLFYGCTNLMVVTLPSKLTAIGDSAFCNCTKLKEITIPVTVRTIGENAFSRNSMGNALKATVLTRDAQPLAIILPLSSMDMQIPQPRQSRI